MDCTTAEVDGLKTSLWNFMTSFDKKCISCKNSLDTKSSDFESAISKKILKEICIKCIIPSCSVNGFIPEESDIVNPPFPFCEECAELVLTLTGLYRQIKAIEEEFNKVRGQVARGIITTFVETQKQDQDESDIFSWWCATIGARSVLCSCCESVQVKTEPEEENNDVSSCHIQDVNPTDLITPLNDDDVKMEMEEIPVFSEPNAYDSDTDYPDEFILPELSQVSSSPKNIMEPVVRLERLKTSRKGTGRSIKNNSDCSSDEQILEENEATQINKEDEYVPPYEEVDNIPKSRMVTRRRAKSLGVDQISSLMLQLDDDEIKSENESQSSANPTSDSESDSSSGVVTSKKRKPMRRQRSKVNKKLRLSSSSKRSIVKTEQNGETSGVKPKKKRIRKRYPPVQCKVCKKMICNQGNLNLHMRIHTGEKPFQCTYCTMSFYKPSNLRVHLTKHTNEKKYECQLCGMKFSENSILRLHKAAKHEIFEASVISECNLCLKEFLYQRNLSMHLKSAHDPDKKMNRGRSNIWCSFCGTDFETEDALKQHKETDEHLAVKTSRKEARKTALISLPQRRPRTDKTANPKRLRKKKSGTEQQEKKDTTTNAKKAVDNRPKTTERSCKQCGITYENNHLFRMHQAKCRPKRDHQCEICGKGFTLGSNLNKHLGIHKDKADKPYLCSLCGEGFAANSSLKLHMTKHTGGSLFKCEYCPEGFNDILRFRKHQNVAHADIHLKDKPFVCPCCQYIYETQELLSEHLESHKELKCKFCGRYFTTFPRVQKHEYTHTGEKPFKCSFCSKTFTQKENLTEHEHRHKGTRPHRCSFCDAGFFRKKEMMKHIEKNHQQDKTIILMTSKDNSSQPVYTEQNQSAVDIDLPTSFTVL